MHAGAPQSVRHPCCKALPLSGKRGVTHTVTFSFQRGRSDSWCGGDIGVSLSPARLACQRETLPVPGIGGASKYLGAKDFASIAQSLLFYAQSDTGVRVLSANHHHQQRIGDRQPRRR